jgi:hypothetical protein
MKKTLLAALALIAAAPAAFAYTCRVDMVDMRGRLLDTFYGREDYNGMCRDGLRDCNRELRLRGLNPGVTGRCVLNNNTPNPIPNPIPNPYPNPIPNPYPNPRMDLDVSLIVENQLVVLHGYSNGDIFNQCMNANIPFGSVDEITMVTNNSRVRRLTTSGWWSNRQDVCNVVMQNLDLTGNPGRTYIQAYGSFENRAFNLNASTKAEALSQCFDAYRATGLSQSDELTIGVANSQMRRITTSGWWNNTGMVCNEVMKAIDAVIF